MYLDERSNCILKAVLSNPDISNAALEESYSLSRRQISYSFTKINDWLEENNYPPIKRTNGGKFVVSPLLMELFGGENDSTMTASYIPSEKERAQLIVLMLLSKEEELSLLHFSSALGVSKNTVLRDIKAAQKLVSVFDLEIIYSRMEGYDIVGSEWDSRRLLVEVLRNIFDMFNGESHIREIAGISTDDIERRKIQMEAVETQLTIKFIDERMKLLPYVIEILLKRIKNRHIITDSYSIDYQTLSDTKEFEAAEILIQDGQSIPEQERLFITLQLLTSNVFSSQVLTDQELPQFKKALKDSLDLFEYKAAFVFKDKEALLNRLLLHMKPAYYRIKYQLTTNYSMLEQVSDEFNAIHYIVKDSMKPIEEYIGCEIPESEVMFVTILIGGHLLNSGKTIPVKKKAVVVCPNGISISQLMEHTLRDLFPEFYFYQAFSIREFEELQLDYDIVFSPIPVQTDKHLFVVNQVITDFEKIQLRQRVIQGIFGLNSSIMNIEQIISIIEKYAKIEEQNLLEKALQDYFSLQLTDEVKQKNDYMLSDFITADMIVVKDSVDNWQQAIAIAAKPLLDKGAISKRYIETMQQQYPSMSPHILLRMNIAIPHSRPQDGVHSVGMSLLKIKNGLSFENNRKVHFVVVIAAVDKKQHLNALLQLMKLAEMNDVISRMAKLDSKKEISQLIQAYSA